MIRIRPILLISLLAVGLPLLLPPQARAQSGSVVTLTPPDWTRWDVGLSIGRRGVDRSDISSEWDRWYESASYAASVGRFLTPNIKLDLEIARSARADLFT